MFPLPFADTCEALRDVAALNLGPTADNCYANPEPTAVGNSSVGLVREIRPISHLSQQEENALSSSCAEHRQLAAYPEARLSLSGHGPRLECRRPAEDLAISPRGIRND